MQTIRPSKTAYRRAIGANAVIILPLVVFQFVNVSRNSDPLMILWILLGTLLVVAVCIVLYFRNVRIDFGEGKVTSTNLFGSTREWKAAEIGKVVLVQQYWATMQPVVPNAFVLDTQSKRIVRAQGSTWTAEQMQELIAGLGKEPIVIAEPIKPKDLHARFPGIVPIWEVRPWLFAFGLAIALIAIVVFALLAVGWLIL